MNYRSKNYKQLTLANFVFEMWNEFWNHPSLSCPKCSSDNVEYYDPFLFSPLRTLKGHRRLKCCVCKFVWRPQKRSKHSVENFLPRI